MKYEIHSAVVIGAGTMGAAIAAHLANAGLRVTLLDTVPVELTSAEVAAGLTLADAQVRNRLVRHGLARAQKSRPASFFSSDQLALLSVGNTEDDFAAVSMADWIVEAVVEDLQIKRELMTRIDANRKAHAIVSTNTSGIPIRDIAAGRSEGFRTHFLGMHFFNPPRYLKLLEIIPTADTLTEVVAVMTRLGEIRLGKGVVRCKDTPNFIGNRIGFGTGAFALHFILENGYTVEEVDAVTGPLIGRPKTATFRLMDLVGVDVWAHVGDNLRTAITDDRLAGPYLQSAAPLALIGAMLDRGWLGNKSGVGFYKEVVAGDGRKEFWPLDLHTLEHAASGRVRYDSIGKARDIEELGERLKTLLAADDKAALLARAVIYQGLQYAASLLPEVADNPGPIDDAVRWGFQHEAGPFEIWDMLGVKSTLVKMVAAGFPAPRWVAKMLESGIKSFYQYRAGRKVSVYDVKKKRRVPLEGPLGLIVLKECKVISRNDGATLYDMGDGVACAAFHTKMNALDEDIFNLVTEALDRTETDFDGLVIGNDAENFSAGANLFMIAAGAQQGMWDMLDQAVRKLQGINMRMRYFPKPVVVAPAGLALGGGCEVIMHASRVVAYGELYTGLVELGAGVIPAGGGTKEIIRRLINPAMRTEHVTALPFLQRAFEQIGLAKVAGSAEEARQMGILAPADRVVLSRERLLNEAKAEVRHMHDSGYHAPAPEQIYAAGRDMFGALQVGAYMLRAGKYISEYDQLLAGKLAGVLCGGELSRPQWVSEQYILDLEREAFLAVCGEAKSQARMWSLLQTGKPLRN